MKGRMPVPSEHAEQCGVLRWWSYRARPELVPLLMAIPNGGARDRITGRRLKDEGVRPGVPDLFLAVPRGGFGGLWLEMKRRHGGQLSPEQRDMLERLTGAGYAVAVCRGFDEAVAQICDYMGWKNEAREQRKMRQPVKTCPGPRPWEHWGDDGD